MRLNELAGLLGKQVREQISTVIAPLERRLAELEMRPPPKDGLPGPAGERGEPGQKGDQGAAGPPGERGEKGDQGAIGPEGKHGSRGEKGEPGSQGFQGVPGPPGERGEKGEPGSVGSIGERGDKGERGDPGPAGERGEKGDPGRDGVPGQDGKDGAPGVHGEKGDTGEKGDIGPPGTHGEKGEKGDLGPTGERGVRGEKGDPGKDGRDGRDGKDGDPGRDAIELAILPDIDPQKSYPRGTWARHANGVWRAATPSIGMDGWECVVGGVARVEIESTDERHQSLLITLSDGAQIRHELKFAHVLDRGVYQPDAEYAKGDGVTWAGSFWIAQTDKATDKPGTSDQWRLAVKRGRDGKDG